jgi:hypothetical protein
MKKIIKLTESDLVQIVKRVIKENNSSTSMISELYDPWSEYGVPLPTGLKFKTPEDYNALSAPPMGVGLTSKDQMGAPTLFKQDPITKKYTLKTQVGGQGDLNAEIDIIAQNLFIIAAALGLTNLSTLSSIESLGGYYKKVLNSVSKLKPPTRDTLSPAGLALVMPTDKRYVDLIKAWPYLVTKKFDPVYQSRIAKYAVLPTQKNPTQ